MSKKVKKVLLIGMIFVMATQLLACGKKLDASAFVKATLDASFHQEYSEYAKFVNEDEEDVKQKNKDTADAEMKVLLAQFSDLEDADYEAYYETSQEVSKKTKYTVKEAEETEEGYVVKVEVSPLDTYTKFNEGFQAKLTEKYADAETVPSDKELVTFMIDYLKECSENSSYGEPKTVEVHVIKDEEGLYSIPEADITNIQGELLTGSI